MAFLVVYVCMYVCMLTPPFTLKTYYSAFREKENKSYNFTHRKTLRDKTAPLQGLSKMTKWKNSPQKKLQEVATANKLIKTDLSNITEQEFRLIVIKLIAGLENSIKDSRESLATEIKGLRNSQEEIKSVINELQSKMETTTVRIEEAEERIGELEDKIMEKEEAEENIKKSRSMRGEFENEVMQ